MCITEEEGIKTAGYVVTSVSWKYDKYHNCGNTDNNYNSAGDSKCDVTTALFTSPSANGWRAFKFPQKCTHSQTETLNTYLEVNKPW